LSSFFEKNNNESISGLAKDQDLIQFYLDEIGRHALLEKEEEIELARTIEEGKEAEDSLANSKKGSLSSAKKRTLKKQVRDGEIAKQKFINANLRLVVSIAKKYKSSGLPLLDLIQEGNLGLIHAVDKFDWQKGFKFSTYATWWIRQSLARGIANSNDIIRMPVHARETLNSLKKFKAEMESSQGRAVTYYEAGEVLGLSPEQVDEILGRGEVVASLSQEVTSENEAQLGDVIADEAESVLEQVARIAVGEQLEKLLDMLEEDEKEIIYYRFFEGPEIRSYIETGKKFGLSRERIRQMEFKAISKMRHPSSNIGAHFLLYQD
jgi:RNA polymerase sigma factor (sigma-70 family)